MHSILTSLLVAMMSLGCAGRALAQPDNSGQAVGGQLSKDSSIDRILDALDARGRDLQSLSADVNLTESDPDTGDAFTRSGKVWLQLHDDGSARFRAMFDRKQSNNRIVEDRVEYLLDGQNLVDRTYRTKTQITRQVLKPGEKMNLLKLGEGPFPLPIGQSKEEVHKLFEVTKPEPKPDDPTHAVHITLVPRPQTQFERNFQSIDVWVDLSDHMPKRIETLDANGVTLRTTDLSNVQINAAPGDADFAMPKIDDSWTLIDEAFQR